MLTTKDVFETVRRVLAGEHARHAEVSITFLSVQQMRALNRRSFRRDHATDVIAFPLEHLANPVGDIYVCPDVAKRSAKVEQVSRREEETRLVVHGVLHALGYHHPADVTRLASEMWELQERYVAGVTRGRKIKTPRRTL